MVQREPQFKENLAPVERPPASNDRDDRDRLAPAPTRATRLGTVVGGGVLAGAAAAFPTQVRLGLGGPVLHSVEQWLALAAILTPLAVLVVALFRRARAGLEQLAGARATLVMATLLWWAVLELSALAVVGTVLRAKTHHHGLAGVTFGIVVLGSSVVTGALAVRGSRLILKMPLRGHRTALVIVSIAAFVTLSLVALKTARSPGLQTAGAIVDLVALFLGAAIASTRGMSASRSLAVSGPPLGLLLLGLGFVCLRAEPELATLFAERAPVQSWILSRF